MAYAPCFHPAKRIGFSRVTDVVPTVHQALGAPVPQHIDPRDLAALFSTDLGEMQSTAAEATEGDHTGYSSEEETDLADRLRSLGCL